MLTISGPAEEPYLSQIMESDPYWNSSVHFWIMCLLLLAIVLALTGSFVSQVMGYEVQGE